LNGTIKSYNLLNVNSDGEENKTSGNRDTEKLTIVFNNGEKLIIDTFCSGCSENSIMLFS